MPDDLLIARNPEEGSSLPYLVRIPLGANGIVLKVRDTWPRTAKIYCHRADWPEDADIIEQLPVRSCKQRGAAVDLVLERSRENRSQFVITRGRGREMIFWQSRRTAKQARPNIAIPTARAHGRTLQIIVDSGERYAYKFSTQQADITKRRLPAGDYAVTPEGATEDAPVIAAVERKSIEDLSGGLMSGKLTYQLADLANLFRAAVVVESPYSSVFKQEYIAGSRLAEALAEAQIRFPSVPIVFCDNRKLAEEWTYRWLGAALHEHSLGAATTTTVSALEGPKASAADIRACAVSAGLDVPAKGRIPASVRREWERRNL